MATRDGAEVKRGEGAAKEDRYSKTKGLAKPFPIIKGMHVRYSHSTGRKRHFYFIECYFSISENGNGFDSEQSKRYYVFLFGIAIEGEQLCL